MSKRTAERDGTISVAERTSHHSDLSLLLAPEFELPSQTTTMTDSRTTRRSRLRAVVGVCLVLALAGMLYLGYFCPDHVCALSSRDPKESARLSETLLSGKRCLTPSSILTLSPFASLLLLLLLFLSCLRARFSRFFYL